MNVVRGGWCTTIMVVRVCTSDHAKLEGNGESLIKDTGSTFYDS